MAMISLRQSISCVFGIGVEFKISKRARARDFIHEAYSNKHVSLDLPVEYACAARAEVSAKLPSLTDSLGSHCN